MNQNFKHFTLMKKSQTTASDGTTVPVLKVTDLINGKVVYDPKWRELLVKNKSKIPVFLCDIRGWAQIMKMHNFNLDQSLLFQDKVGQFIADAINEKIERDFSKTGEPPVRLSRPSSNKKI